MGSASSSYEYDSYERPVHAVTVSGFYMGKYEVTQAEWVAVMGSNPSISKGDNRPVENVSWYDVVKYCNALSAKEDLTKAYTINGTTVTWNSGANGYRLPTEAEWEYAARGGVNHDIYEYSGSNDVDEVAWYSGNSAGGTHPVGKKKANGLGLYDMSGNVFEWCWDWYGVYSSGAQTNPTGASSGTMRVGRGGCYAYDAVHMRPAYRFGMSESGRNSSIGFRLVLPLD